MHRQKPQPGRKSRCFWIFSGIIALLAAPVWIGIIYLSRTLIVSDQGWQALGSDELISYKEKESAFWNSNISNYGWLYNSCNEKCKLFHWNQESWFPQWTPYLLFALSGTWIWFSTTLLSYARSCELQEKGHETSWWMLATCLTAGLCFQIMSLLPANMIMLEDLKWLGVLHLVFAFLGFTFALVHHAIHLKTAWGIIRVEIKLFFLACLLVVPPCLVMWRIGHWKDLPVDYVTNHSEIKNFLHNPEASQKDHPTSLKVKLDREDLENCLEVWRPGSLYEWIAAATLFFYFTPYALWFFKRAMQKDSRLAGQLVDIEIVV